MVLEKIFLIGQSQQELTMVAILVVRSARNMAILYRIPHTSFLQSKKALYLLVSKEIFIISANQKQEFTMATMFLSNWDEMRKPSIDIS
jgi:hypothetical protein